MRHFSGNLFSPLLWASDLGQGQTAVLSLVWQDSDGLFLLNRDWPSLCWPNPDLAAWGDLCDCLLAKGKFTKHDVVAVICSILNAIRKRVPEWTWCRRVRLWKVSLTFIWLIIVYAYSAGKPPTVGHPPTPIITPWPWGRCARIVFRTLIGTHQSASFSRQKVRLLEVPWTQWPTAVSSRSGFRLLSGINVVVYDAIVICHPIFSP